MGYQLELVKPGALRREPVANTTKGKSDPPMLTSQTDITDDRGVSYNGFEKGLTLPAPDSRCRHHASEIMFSLTEQQESTLPISKRHWTQVLSNHHLWKHLGRPTMYQRWTSPSC